MAKKNDFKDDKYKIIEVDVTRIRTRPTMFISSLGEAGILHLCKELIDNASDEALKKNSPCDEFTIELSEKQIRVYDNGRGIPTDIMQKVYETMQAGTNMTRSGGATRGENSLGGSTCLLALSSYLKVVSTRPTENKRLTLVYHEAELSDRILEDYDGKEHGLDVTFRPSKKVMGDDKIPVKLVVDWLKDFDYVLHHNTKVTYVVDGVTHHIHHKYLPEFFMESIPQEKHLSQILTCSFSNDIDETFMDVTTHRKFSVDMALMYATPTEDIRHSWMNMIHTPQNGDHVDGIIKGFIKFITAEVIKRNKRLADEDIRKDILAHLQLVVKAECDMAHMFAAQSKHTVTSKQLGVAIAKSCYEQLIKDNDSAIASIVEAIIDNHRARIEGEKARNIASSTKAIKTWKKPDSYIPCTSVKTELPKELFLVEGKSAGGGIRSARAKHQAILQFRGKSLNVWDVDLNRAMESAPWQDLVKVLGCGIGPTFDIKKLNFDKIIITTDADIDGYHIRVGFMAFFAKFLPEIIEAGKLYIAEPPLYKLVSGKNVSYVASQTEYLKACIDSIGDIEISFPGKK